MVGESSPPACLPPGEYKLELYLDGQLARTSTAPGSWTQHRPTALRTLRLGACVPHGWRGPERSGLGSSWRDGKRAEFDLTSVDRRVYGKVRPRVAIPRFARSWERKRHETARPVARLRYPLAGLRAGQLWRFRTRRGTLWAAGGLTSDEHVVLALAAGPGRATKELAVLDSIGQR
jgi:hypothetical protein